MPKRYRLLPRLGLSLLALQSCLVALLLFYTLQRLPHFLHYSVQLRSASLATQLANRVQSALLAPERYSEVAREFAALESVNREARAYLLDEQGEVLLTSSPSQLLRSAVDLRRVQPLLGEKIPRVTLLGDDPATPDDAIVSIARVRRTVDAGYIYLTIRPTVFHFLRTATGIRSYLVLVLPLVVVTSLFSWWMMKLYTSYLLRQFGGVVDAARSLARGDRSKRAPVISADEIGHLAASFNVTADAILLQEEEVARAERSRRFLVAGVLHDLRAPLGAIRGLLELLSNGARNATADFERAVATIRSCVSRQRRFVESLEQLADIELAAESFEFGTVELDTLVTALVESLGPRATEADVELDYSPHAVPSIAGDGFWIGRALTNVVINAINYSTRGGRVTISLAEIGDSIELTVADTGIGISPDETERIFEHFYRASAVVTEGREGSGLGLAVVKRVLERHHGTIAVESALGRGTTFSLRFPKQPPKEETQANPTPIGSARVELAHDEPPHLVALATPEYFLTALGALSWVTTQFVCHTAWPTVTFLLQVALLWLTFRWRPLARYRGQVFPLQALFMGAMFLFLDREQPNASRVLVACSVTLSTLLVIAFAPISRRAKCSYVTLSLFSFAVAAFWFNRFELVAAGMGAGGALGVLLIVAFTTSRGRELRIRFALSVATVMTFSMLVIGYETITGVMFLSEVSARDTLDQELPAVTAALAQFSPVSASEIDFLEEHVRFTQFNPSLFGMITSPSLTPIGYFGERGRDFRLEQGPNIDVTKLCASSVPVGMRALFGVIPPQCALLTMDFFGAPAKFIVGRLSGRADAIERHQLEEAVVELLLLGSLFITLGVRLLGAFLHRSFSAPLRSLLAAVLAARSEQLLPDTGTLRVAELVEIEEAFCEMVETLRLKQHVVAEADRKLRELVVALLSAVRPFNSRLNMLLPECERAVREGEPSLPDWLSHELMNIVYRETEVVDQLFMLTKLDLGELALETGSLTLEELLWGLDKEPHIFSDGTSRRLLIEYERAHDYFAIDPRYVLKLIQLCAEELHAQLPPEVAVTLRASYTGHRLEFTFLSDGAVAKSAGELDSESIRVSLIKKLVETLGGEVVFDAHTFAFWVTTQGSGDLR